MKRFDEPTKKLIKNVASLITSALVLIAATVAWFSTGGNAKAGVFQGNTQSTHYSIEYSRVHEVSDVLKSATRGVGSVAQFTYSNSRQPTVSDLDDLMTLVWDSTGGSGAWDIPLSNSQTHTNGLYPGEYDIFKMDFQSRSGGSAPKLVINGISCLPISGSGALSETQIDTVYQNTYLYAVAVKTTTTVIPAAEEGADPTTQTVYEVIQNTSDPLNAEDCVVCDSFYNLIDKTQANWRTSGKISTLTNIPVTGTSNISILIFIGIPGEEVITITDNNGTPTPQSDNLINAHDALRQIGARLSFTSVNVAD